MRRHLFDVRGRVVLTSLALVALLAASLPAGGEPVAGQAGTDTSLPATDSAVTVQGRDRFSSMSFTVNQTANLGNQAVSIEWTGGTLTTKDGNYVQVMQCWGDDDGTNPQNPGPPPEQCVYGAADGVYGGRLQGIFGENNNTLTRVIARADLPTYEPGVGYVDTRTNAVWRPFRAVDGTVVDVQIDPFFNPTFGGGNYWQNQYFNSITTNEIVIGRTRPNGTGEELFEVATGIENSGLGCGQQVQPLADGSVKAPTCWLVIVPRAEAAYENVGLISDPGSIQVSTSPLAPRAWQNRIAIPLDFNPVEPACNLTDKQTRIAGSELIVPAVTSWQPALCEQPGRKPYSYGTISDATARQQLVSDVNGAPGMVVVSEPLAAETVEPDDPVVYAPLAVSGTVIGFNIERNPKSGNEEVEALATVRVAELNLTPRLVAKLLTQSYRNQVDIALIDSGYAWSKANPRHLAVDPDFLQFNPEFELLSNTSRNLSGLVLPARNSDASRQLWSWILADPEAKAWIDGQPDEWGMQVNPVYATTASANSTGSAFADPVPDSYPKADPYCYQSPPINSGKVTPPQLCTTDWMPYVQSLRDAARATRAADDGAKTNLDNFAVEPSKAYKAAGPQSPGNRSMLSITDSASAALYGLQTARLSRAGDNGDDRDFVAATAESMDASVAAMEPETEPNVLEPDPLADAPGAYPLTSISYAAVTPLSLEAAEREEYAAFLDYAAGPGQVSGEARGELPRGYAPLSDELRAQTTAAAEAVRTLQPSSDPPPASGGSVSAEGGSSTGGSSSGTSSTGTSSGSSRARSSSAGTSTDATATDTTTAPTDVDASDSDSGEELAITPVVAISKGRFVLPALAVLALASALFVLELTKRPRRARSESSAGKLS